MALIAFGLSCCVAFVGIAEPRHPASQMVKCEVGVIMVVTQRRLLPFIPPSEWHYCHSIC